MQEKYVISSIKNLDNYEFFLRKLRFFLNAGLKLFQFREPKWPDGVHSKSLRDILHAILNICSEYNALMLVNSIHPINWCYEANGMHCRSIDLKSKTCFFKSYKKEKDLFLGVSTHNIFELKLADFISADFATLGPVLPTMSHPKLESMGWAYFSKLVRTVRIPVYAIGGQSNLTLELAKIHGAYGIAGIRGDF